MRGRARGPQGPQSANGAPLAFCMFFRLVFQANVTKIDVYHSAQVVLSRGRLIHPGSNFPEPGEQYGAWEVGARLTCLVLKLYQLLITNCTTSTSRC